MAVSVPNALALASIVDGSLMVASDERNNYSAVQVGVNGLIAMFTNAATKGDLVVSAGGGSFDKLGVGADGQSVVADSTQPLGMKWGAGGGGLQKLWDSAEAGVTFPVASITTGALPQTCSHLRVEYSFTGSAAGFVQFRVNGDSGGNYWGAQDINTAITNVVGGTQLSLQHLSVERGGGFLDIRDSSSAVQPKNMTGMAYNQSDGSGTQRLFSLGAMWNSGAAVSTLTFLASAGTFTAGRIIVYGKA